VRDPEFAAAMHEGVIDGPTQVIQIRDDDIKE
jgi:hypothetical protein